ncbi:MAG: TolC family protein [bacterium]
MSTRDGFFLAASLAVAVSIGGCVGRATDAGWPAPLPLGAGYAAYRPPLEPSAPASAVSPDLEEPTGILSLRQALSLALMHNPGLRAFSWEVRALEARALQDGLPANPEIEIEIENWGGTGASGGLDETESTVQVSQLLELAGKPSKRRQLASLDRDLAGWDFESRRIDVFAETTKAFVDMLAAQERVRLNRELVRLAEQVRHAAAERVLAGRVSPIEETRARVALAAQRIELETAQRELEAARANLAASWSSRSPRFERVEGDLFATAALPDAEELAARVSRNPEVARWSAEVEQRLAAVALEQAGRIPDVTLSGGVRRLNESEETAFVGGFSVPVPIFDRNQGALLEARYRLSKADEEKRAAVQRLSQSFALAYQGLAAAHARVTRLQEEVVPGAREAFDAVNEGFRQGKFDYLEALDAQRTFFEARSRYIEALSELHKAVAEVERLIAGPLGGNTE